MKPFNLIKRWTKGRFYERFLSCKGSPRNIALGFALGVIVGMTPFIGIHIISGVLLAAMFGGNKITAIVGVNITNVLTAPFIYPINYWVGYRLAGISEKVEWTSVSSYADILRIIEHSPLILADLLVGGMILGIPIAVIGYYGVFKLVCRHRTGI